MKITTLIFLQLFYCCSLWEPGPGSQQSQHVASLQWKLLRWLLVVQLHGGNGRGSNFAEIIETNEAACFCFGGILPLPTIYIAQRSSRRTHLRIRHSDKILLSQIFWTRCLFKCLWIHWILLLSIALLQQGKIEYLAFDCFFNFNKIRRAWSDEDKMKMVRHFHLKLKTQRKVKTLICGPLAWGQVADGAVQQVPRSQS